MEVFNWFFGGMETDCVVFFDLSCDVAYDFASANNPVSFPDIPTTIYCLFFKFEVAWCVGDRARVSTNSENLACLNGAPVC